MKKQAIKREKKESDRETTACTELLVDFCCPHLEIEGAIFMSAMHCLIAGGMSTSGVSFEECEAEMKKATAPAHFLSHEEKDV